MTSLDNKLTRREFLEKGAKGAGKVLFGGAVIKFLSGCKDSDKPPIIPTVNHNPSIITPDLGSALEGQDINKTIEGEDQDGEAAQIVLTNFQ